MGGIKVTIVWIALIFVFLLIVLCVYLARFVVLPKHHTIEESVVRFKNKPLWHDYENLQSISLTMSDGYEIHAYYLENEKPGKRFVILLHGYTANHIAMVPFIDMYLRRGYNCILYDQRGHGGNVNCKCTFGLKEHRDLAQIAHKMRERFGSDIVLGVHGVSMGAATAVMSLKADPPFDFVISDCGYADLSGVLRHKLKAQFHLPAFLVTPSGWISRILFGFDFAVVRPVDSLSRGGIPVCFMHGGKDSFIPADHSKRMYESAKASGRFCEIHLFPEADHAVSVYSDPERYDRILNAFLDRIGC